MSTYHQPRDEVGNDDQASTQTELRRDIHDPATYTDSPGKGWEDGESEDRQRQRFGGVNWGAGVFGWMIVVAMAVVLSGVVVAALAALGRTADVLPTAADGSRVVGVLTAAICFGVLLLAYYTGGYVAGRMSRFDGGKQGAWVWVIGLLAVSGTAGFLLLFGPQVDILGRLNLPAITVPTWSRGVGGVAVGVVALVVSLLAAMAGGKVGCRYHRRVDDAAYL